jgi:hypothetical protein
VTDLEPVSPDIASSLLNIRKVYPEEKFGKAKRFEGDLMGVGALSVEASASLVVGLLPHESFVILVVCEAGALCDMISPTYDRELKFDGNLWEEDRGVY